ncbi:MAG TPA: cation:proton antiporter, partial [Ferruginibacter sp.]|nr:cation:proton antiporter [Ferruginibacter sp.]
MNALLFVLIGLEILILEFDRHYLVAGLIAIPITLLARYLSLLLPATVFKKYINTNHKTIRIMTWGGLRGGLSIAMALSLTNPLPRNQFVCMVYVVVVFSIIVQGLTVSKVVGKLLGRSR